MHTLRRHHDHSLLAWVCASAASSAATFSRSSSSSRRSALAVSHTAVLGPNADGGSISSRCASVSPPGRRASYSSAFCDHKQSVNILRPNNHKERWIGSTVPHPFSSFSSVLLYSYYVHIRLLHSIFYIHTMLHILIMFILHSYYVLSHPDSHPDSNCLWRYVIDGAPPDGVRSELIESRVALAPRRPLPRDYQRTQSVRQKTSTGAPPDDTPAC